jgi:hypothetical protein
MKTIFSIATLGTRRRWCIGALHTRELEAEGFGVLRRVGSAPSPGQRLCSQHWCPPRTWRGGINLQRQVEKGGALHDAFITIPFLGNEACAALTGPVPSSEEGKKVRKAAQDKLYAQRQIFLNKWVHPGIEFFGRDKALYQEEPWCGVGTRRCGSPCRARSIL